MIEPIGGMRSMILVKVWVMLRMLLLVCVLMLKVV